MMEKGKRQKPFAVICHNVRSRENVGSVFRTADAFGISKIYLTGYTPLPPHEKIVKTALGAETWVPWEHRKTIAPLLKELRREGFFIATLEQARGSISLPRFRPRFPLALVVGNEVQGLSSAILRRSDAVLEIPMLGRKESLNVAVAFGVAAYHIRYPVST